MKMSAFPLPVAGFPNLSATQLLMSAAGGLNMQAPPNVSGSKDIPSGSPTSVVALSGVGRVPSIPNDLSVGTGPHTTSGYLPPHLAANLPPSMVDPRIFYTAMNGGYEMKENADALLVWRHIAAQAQQAANAGVLSYDAHAAAMATASFSYPSYPSIDLNGARRKNATRETTSTLKAWLYEHRKNPYPTKGEKIMLAIITKMTLTQVSTWFANARRRLKKENKMTWSPRNRTDDGSSVDDEDKPDNDDGIVGDDDDVSIDLSDFETENASPQKSSASVLPSTVHTEAATHNEAGTPQSSASTPDADSNSAGSKPRIWSIADVATNKPAAPAAHTPVHHRPSSMRHRPYPIPNGTAFRPWFDNSYRHLVGHPATNLAGHPATMLSNPSLSTGRPTTTSSLRVPHLSSTISPSVVSPSRSSPPSLTDDRTIKPDSVSSSVRAQARERSPPSHSNLSKHEQDH